MSEKTDDLIQKTDLPHNKWLDDNNEFVSKNKKPVEISTGMKSINLLYSQYTQGANEQQTKERYERLMAKSYEIADMLQTWREDEYKDEFKDDNIDSNPDNNDNPEPKSDNNADTPAGVQMIDGKPLTEEEIQQQKQQAQNQKTQQQTDEEEKLKLDKQQKNNAVKTIFGLTIVSIAAILGIKYFGNRN